MTSHLINRLIFGLLFFLSIGTSGIAITRLPFMRSNSYLITVDCDSFRTESAEKLVESIHNKYFFKISNKEIHDKVIASQPIENVIVKHHLFKPLHIDIKATKPVVMVSNQEELISLSTSGMPFLHWPEHGDLPCYGVPADFDHNTLLHPDNLLQDFYRLIVEIQTGSFLQLTRFSAFLAGDENSMVLFDHKTQDHLKLPREHLRNRTEHLRQVDAWLSSSPASTKAPLEFDARFSGIIILRSLPKGVYHG